MVQFNPSPHPREQVAPPIPQKAEREKFSFSKFATDVAYWAGSSAVFVWACAGIVLWGVTGPHSQYSDTWQLVVNTSTTIVTFLMVFLIHNTQKRDTRAINLKLDEIIRSQKHAHNELIDIEKLNDKELEELAQHYEKIRAACDERAAAKAAL
jgi:low affinity Fe/Cu permease